MISSSPRKDGNSDTLCDEFVKGVKEAGNSVDKIFLKDEDINFCLGCGVCNTTQKCVQKDSVAKILDLMIDSDVIVMATPVYFYTMCGQMKTFIDRCCPAYTKIVGKDFYFIMSAADTREAALMRTLDGFRGFLACLDGANEKDSLFATGIWHKDEVKKTRYMKEAFEMGKSV